MFGLGAPELILILIIGSLYGAIAGYFGGTVDLIMMRIVDIIYTVPDVLIIIKTFLSKCYHDGARTYSPGYL